MITLDIFQTGVTYIQWRKWFMKTRQTLEPYYQTNTRALLATILLPLPSSIHTLTQHTTCTFCVAVFID